MYSLHGAQDILIFSDKRILKSSASGTTNKEEIIWLTKSILHDTAVWKEAGWGYLCCIGDMAPVTPDVSEALIELHKKIEAAGCKAIAFINPNVLSDPGSMVIDAQAKKHQKKSKVSYKEKHFRTEDEGIKWLEKILE